MGLFFTFWVFFIIYIKSFSFELHVGLSGSILHTMKIFPSPYLSLETKAQWLHSI